MHVSLASLGTRLALAVWLAAFATAGLHAAAPAPAAPAAAAPAPTAPAATTPAPAASAKDQQRVQKLIRQLGDKDYFVRQRAETELSAIGADAFDALSEAAGDEDPEIAAHARHLLRLIRVEWSGQGDPKIVKDLLQNYTVRKTPRTARC